MAKTGELKVLEVCKVAPKPTPPDSTLPLTFFDVMWLTFQPSQRLYFYDETQTDYEPVVAQLKKSLSLTLQTYLPLAGNLLWLPDSEKPVLKYIEGDGVSLTVGESTADFHHLSSHSTSCSSFHELKEYNHLLPKLLLVTDRTQSPVMSLQVTLFPGAGFCVGYAIHHAVLDGKSIAMFMHSWASICKSGTAEDSTAAAAALVPELIPSYDRSLIRDPCNLEQLYMDVSFGPNDGSRKKILWTVEAKSSDDTMLGTFELQKEDLDNLKRLVSVANSEDKDIDHNHRANHVSSYTVTLAYIWVNLVRTRRRTTEGDESVNWNQNYRLLTYADCRARLEPPIPLTYLGNCVIGILIDTNVSDLIGDQGVAIAAKAIGEAMEHLKEGVLKGKYDLLKQITSTPPSNITLSGGSNRFEHYKTDFGWGNPRMVKLTSNGINGAINISDSRDGNGGVEVGIVLKKHEVADFISLFKRGLQG